LKFFCRDFKKSQVSNST